MKFAVALLIAGLALPAFAAGSADFTEEYRIKINNIAGGSIEVSRDEGKNWQTVGSVIYPTLKLNLEGYAAARYVADGRVAATAVNAIHIKSSGEVFSLLPREMLLPPKHYKSYLSPNSSIYTDIPAGASIFGGGFAPLVGNLVMVSRPARPVVPLPTNYLPALGDKLYILVDRPADLPKEIVFENRAGGRVIMYYFSGASKVVGRVVRPVAGIGRFEGTRYAAAGRLRANHAGVIDISTSPAGNIGGFQIVPANHSADLKFPKGNSQWLVVGPAEGEVASLEGQAPLFKYFLKPQYAATDLMADNWDNKLRERFLVEAKLGGLAKWQPLPIRQFDDYDLSGGLPNWANSALVEVSHLRILFPCYN